MNVRPLRFAGLPAIICGLLLLSSPPLSATQQDYPAPAGSSYLYGNNLAVLPNGNIVVVDQEWSPTSNPGQKFGAVYLLNGADLSIISTLQGSHTGTGFGDIVGSGGITVLANGNFVIGSPSWNDGRGAATWGNATTGFSATAGATVVIDSTNSLVGSHGLSDPLSNDAVGISVTSLPNGNYILTTPKWNGFKGAVTWGNGATGITGVVDASNSLVGSTGTNSSDGDVIGTAAGSTSIVVVLSNGNYVVPSPKWDNGAVTNVGAATWCDGSTGRTGVVSASNSLVGTNASDAVGTGVVALTNGNYVVRSTAWKNGSVASAGAVTWASGTSGITGPVSSSNSLVGSTASDQVGGLVVALTNGNYVVDSPNWDGPVVDAGAVTWCDGSTGRTGPVTTANSLYGTTAADRVGLGSVVALTDGNYVVGSNAWDNGSIINAGAATWGNGATGITGPVTTSNSLYGTSTNDGVASVVPVALKNGNYVVRSSNWNNGAATTAGAATWGNGTTGTTGPVSTSNSIYGTTAADNVGLNVLALANGNYVTYTNKWHNGAVANAGAATWGNGTTGTAGAVSAANSLVGSTVSDGVPSAAVALTNGNYVLCSRFWDNGATADVGAVTWGNGNTGVTGTISAANSLVGTTASDQFGSTAPTPLPNGDFLAFMINWTNPAIPLASAAALSYCDGRAGSTKGTISNAFSVLGTSTFNGFGGVRAFAWDPVRNRALVNRVDDKMLTALTVPVIDYVVTTTGGNVVCTDASGNSDTLTVTNPNGVGITFPSLKFAAPGRTFSVDSGAAITGDSGVIDRTLTNSITINAGGGDDTIVFGGFAGLPNLTVNGGTGNDLVNITTRLIFKNGASLNIDLQDDDASPGADSIVFDAQATVEMNAASTGGVTLRASKSIVFNSLSQVIAGTGPLIIEANQQTTPTSGDFAGVFGSNVQLTAQGTNPITIKGRGGDAGAASTVPNAGVRFNDHSVIGMLTGLPNCLSPLNITGTSGAGGNDAAGVILEDSTVGSNADVTLVGTAVGNVAGARRAGVVVKGAAGSTLSAYDPASLSITGTGAPAAGSDNAGIFFDAGSGIQVENGATTLTGTGGQATGSTAGTGYHGITLFGNLLVSGAVTLNGTGGISAAPNNFGVYVSSYNNPPNVPNIFIAGGQADITGTSNGSFGIVLDSSGGNVIDTTSNGGNITLTADAINIDDVLASGSTVLLTSPTDTVTFKPLTAGIPIILGLSDAPGTSLGLTDAELGRVSTGNIVIGSSTAGNIELAANIAQISGTNMSFISGGDITLTAGTLSNAGATVTFTPGTGHALYGGTNGAVVDLFSPPPSGTVKLSSGRQFGVKVGSGTNYDSLTAKGFVDISGTSLLITDASSGAYTPSAAQNFTLINNDGTDAVVGTFSGFAEGAIVAVNGVNKRITYVGGDGNDVVLLGAASTNADLSSLVINTAAFTPAFASGTLTYTSEIPRSISSLTVTPVAADSNAVIKARINSGTFSTVTSGSASGAFSPNLGANTIEVQVTAPDNITQKTYSLNVRRLTYLEGWRRTHFSSIANSGNAADAATPRNDGLPNLMKFALGMNPTASGVSPMGILKNSGNLEFTYPRSVEAVAECTFIVEWSDTLLAGSWVATGVTENVLSDNGTLQQVKAIVPATGVDRRFVRLRVTNP